MLPYFTPVDLPHLREAGQERLAQRVFELLQPMADVALVPLGVLEPDTSAILQVAWTPGDDLVDNHVLGRGESDLRCAKRHAPQRLLPITRLRKDEVNAYPAGFVAAGQNHRAPHERLDILHQHLPAQCARSAIIAHSLCYSS